MKTISRSWAAEELKTLDLGDRRLNTRAVLLAEQLGAKPSSSIPKACGGWAETLRAYRFFGQRTCHGKIFWPPTGKVHPRQ